MHVKRIPAALIRARVLNSTKNTYFPIPIATSVFSFVRFGFILALHTRIHTHTHTHTPHILGERAMRRIKSNFNILFALIKKSSVTITAQHSYFGTDTHEPGLVHLCPSPIFRSLTFFRLCIRCRHHYSGICAAHCEKRLGILCCVFLFFCKLMKKKILKKAKRGRF